MKFGKEKEEVVHKTDIDFFDSEMEVLADYGLRRIKNDPDALINYAINVLLKEYIDEFEDEEKEGVKNG